MGDKEDPKAGDKGQKKKEKLEKLKQKLIEEQAWPNKNTHKISLGKKPPALIHHDDPVMMFNLVKTNVYGKKQKRSLALSKSGVSNLNGNNCQWFVKAKDVYAIEKDPAGDKTKFSLVFLHRYQFEADTEDQVVRMMEAFKSFKVGMLIDGKPNVGGDSSDSSLDAIPGGRNTREEFFRRQEDSSDSDQELSPRELPPIERHASPSRRKAKAEAAGSSASTATSNGIKERKKPSRQTSKIGDEDVVTKSTDTSAASGTGSSPPGTDEKPAKKSKRTSEKTSAALVPPSPNEKTSKPKKPKAAKTVAIAEKPTAIVPTHEPTLVATKYYDSSDDEIQHSPPMGQNFFDDDDGPRESDSFGLSPLTPNPISPLVERRDAELHYEAANAAAAVGAARYNGKDKKKRGDKRKPAIEDFELLRLIGTGSFAQVMLVRKKETGKLFAMKVLKKEEIFKRNQVEHTQNERFILAELKHPFMVRLRYSFQTESKLYMVLDYVRGGELFYHLRKATRFAEERARFYIAEVILALDYLHRHNVIYRDLKPENILLSLDGHIKLTDFGLSKTGITSVGGRGEGQTANTFCGTPEYLAPEIITGIGHGKAVDWWSVGIMLYEMLVGRPPFASQNRNQLYLNTIRGNINWPATMSEAAKNLLQRLLHRRPEERLGSRSVTDIKTHPFFNGLDWNRLEAKEIEPPFKPPCIDEKWNLDEPDLDNPVVLNEFLRTNSTDGELLQQAAFPDFTFSEHTQLSDSRPSIDSLSDPLADSEASTMSSPFEVPT